MSKLRETGHSSALSPRVWAVTGIPLVLVVVAAGLLLLQVVRLERAIGRLEHSDTAIALCVKTERNLRVEQAALSQLWLTGDGAGDVRAAGTEFRMTLGELEEHVADNEAQLEQLKVLDAAYRGWHHFTRELSEHPVAESFDENLRSSERLVEQVVAAIRVIEREERVLRSERAEEVSDIMGVLTYAALPTLLLLALAVGISARREVSRMAHGFNEAMAGRQQANHELELQAWVREQLRKLGVLRDDAGFEPLCSRALRCLVDGTNAVVGSVYVVRGDNLEVQASHGVGARVPKTWSMGEGLVGEAARSEQVRHIDDLPADYLRVESSVGTAAIKHLALIPCAYKGEVNGVIELGFLSAPDERSALLLEEAGAALAMALAVTSKKVLLQSLLMESRQQARALQEQQAQLASANRELSSQSEALQAAHAQLEARKAELEESNRELLNQRNALDETRRELERRAIELRRADRYKNEFLASMSHELRTPLNSILILSKGLCEAGQSRLTPEELKYAETIHTSGQDLLALINDVLDLATIEAGAVLLSYSATTIEEVVGQVIRVTEPLARDRGLELTVELGDPEKKLVTDVRRVQQILKNLLSNACKFTREGGVTLAVSSSDERVEFSVTDTGLGIAEEDQEAIFTPFRQLDGHASRQFSGTGLGLSISRDLARYLGGDITLCSRLGSGSRFALALPVAPSEAMLDAARPAPANTSAPRPAPATLAGRESPGQDMERCLLGQKVLLVDNDVRSIFALTHLLERRGAVLSIARSEGDALRQLGDDDFDVVLLDPQLPQGSGLDVARKIRDLPGPVARVPIVALAETKEMRQSCLDAGADDWLPKPIEAEQLVSLMRSWTTAATCA